MNKPLQVSLFSILLIGFFFMLASFYQSCKKKEIQDRMSTEEADQSLTEVAEKFSKDEFFEDDTILENNKNQIWEESKKSASESQSETIRNSPPATQSSRPSSSTGRYVVITGNFLVKENAEAMVRKLKKEGFSDAEMVVFDLSQYYTVIAGRFDSQSYANSISTELKRIGIEDNYVMTKK